MLLVKHSSAIISQKLWAISHTPLDFKKPCSLIDFLVPTIIVDISMLRIWDLEALGSSLAEWENYIVIIFI